MENQVEIQKDPGRLAIIEKIKQFEREERSGR